MTGMHLPRSALRRQRSIEDGKLGAMSDGEADRHRILSSSLPRRRSPSQFDAHQPHLQGQGGSLQQQGRRSSFVELPHYATMSKAQSAWANHHRAGDIRYTSQPHLGPNILDYDVGPPQQQQQQQQQQQTHRPQLSLRRSSGSNKGPPPLASKSQLERLNYRTSAVITKVQQQQPNQQQLTAAPTQQPPTKTSSYVPNVMSKQPQPKYVQPVSKQQSRIPDDEYLFPDLPPPPDALLEPSSDSTSATPRVQNARNDARGKKLSRQNSHSSSLDDLRQWVTSATDITIAAQQRYREATHCSTLGGGAKKRASTPSSNSSGAVRSVRCNH